MSTGRARARLLGLAAAALPGLAAALAVAARQALVVAAPRTTTGLDCDIPNVATRPMQVQAIKSLVRLKRLTAADARILPDPLGIEPNRTERWTVPPDGKTCVFKLRRRVKSPWGDEMTADDRFGNKCIDQNPVGVGACSVSAMVPPAVPGHAPSFTRPKRDIARAKRWLAGPTRAGIPRLPLRPRSLTPLPQRTSAFPRTSTWWCAAQQLARDART